MKYVVGLSGGLDSSVVAALAAPKCGEQNMIGLIMPTRTTPQRDVDDAIKLAEWLQIEYKIIPIDGIIDRFPFEDPKVRGNIAARVRMTMLYAYANAVNGRVLGTSDRSEYELGFFTKWGDGAADLYPIIHLYKTEVKALARQLGLPQSIIDKPSSPALIEGQTAEGEIGFSYEEIDAMLKGDKPMHSDLQRRIDSNRHKRMGSSVIPATQNHHIGLL